MIVRRVCSCAAAAVTDVNRQTWSGESSLLVHPSELYVGVKTEQGFLTAGEPVVNWQTYDEAGLAFGRGAAGHVVLNASDEPMEFDVQTSLAAGEYCDLVTASRAGACDGTVVSVSDSGRFRATLGPTSALAILRPR